MVSLWFDSNYERVFFYFVIFAFLTARQNPYNEIKNAIHPESLEKIGAEKVKIMWIKYDGYWNIAY